MAPTITRFNQTTKVATLTDAATINIDCNSVEIGTLTLTQNCTIATPTGNPVEGQLLLLVIKSASSFTLTFDTGYEAASSLVLPSATTGSNKIDSVAFRRSTTQNKWIFVGTTIRASLPPSTTNPNYLINSAFQVAQAATSATITAGTARPTASLGYPVVDSWFCYSVGGNPTLAQVVGSNTTANRLQLTGAASITSVGIGQRLEAINTTSLANKTVTLSFECSNSLLTSLTVVANRPTTTANTFGTIATPTKTLINSTNVAINSTLTRYSLTFTCPQDVDKGLEILFVLGAQTSGTFVLANVKLEEGSVATPYVPNTYSDELRRCKRYFQWIPYNQLFYAHLANEPNTVWQPYPVQLFRIPIIGGLLIDPEAGQLVLNNLANDFIRPSKKGVEMQQTAAAAGISYTLGYRSSFSAYIP